MYEELFGAKTLYIQRIKDRPIDKKLNIDENDLNKIDQCVLQFGDIKIMIADDTEGLPITQGNNISLCLTFDQVEETKHVYDQLIEKGSEVLKTFSPEFYTEGYGYVRDPYGISLHLFTKRKN
ncbi:TPA: VOC family protein [Staphylococcus aureus]|uniref:3-demethylubiquinone-9 3-methyltransferase n=1 Tax=Staphylococcus haemolyticus TaxID=1283 RepID=A0A1B1UYG6_STAHA|nr:3-demethylubiquinone-9 3-methyltransferase [Staphylococcus haemolyticus]EGQ3247386.1 VOC family protein [Staphylococcus pseudintermedius]MCG1671598.1 VOC family protein [Staphylococcus epidermidis]RNA89956.1 VOC family protein [Staphylococcus aureus]EIT1241475.1 VOC family protein [Staphylococcus pseudintermedius]